MAGFPNGFLTQPAHEQEAHGVSDGGPERVGDRQNLQGQEQGLHRHDQAKRGRREGSVFTHSRPELVPFLAIGAFAGLRSAEIERLDWSEVHLADRFIEVKTAKAKTASRRIVPITENLAKWLAPRAEKEGRVVPFDNMGKQLGWLVDDVNAGLKKAAEEAGKDPEKLKAAVWKKNALRHSFISYRVADIQNVNQVALEAGNSSAIIFRHYRELVRGTEAKKWFGIKPTTDGKVTVMPKAEEKAVGVAV